MRNIHYLTARQAAEELGVTLPTLYAYVSRGLVRSESTGDGRRARRYRAEDVRKLKEGKKRRQESGRSAGGVLHWGEPVLDSALTLIANDRLYYRGRDAVALSEAGTLEEVAELVWTGRPAEGGSAGSGLASDASALSDRDVRAVGEHGEGLAPVEAFNVVLQLAAAEDSVAYDLRPNAVARTGYRILRLLASTAVGGHDAGVGVARTLQSVWAPREPRAVALMDAALILCVDHEFNVSAFTARCVASAGASPYAVVAAGLCALGGYKHGGNTERVEDFLKEVAASDRVRDVVAGRLRRGDSVPGFGHPLYPEGDPRAEALLNSVAAAHPGEPAVEVASAVVREAADTIGEYPTIDFALVVLSRALSLPPGSALALFALGRTVGWIGHAIEQYESNQMIRPRARYVGEQPLL